MTETTPTATITRLPPPLRPLPAPPRSGEAFQPVLNQLATASDDLVVRTFHALVAEMRRRSLANLIAETAHEIALEDMSADALAGLARSIDAQNDLGGVA